MRLRVTKNNPTQSSVPSVRKAREPGVVGSHDASTTKADANASFISSCTGGRQILKSNFLVAVSSNPCSTAKAKKVDAAAPSSPKRGIKAKLRSTLDSAARTE